jgi:endo-1,4-beta-xylanase
LGMAISPKLLKENKSYRNILKEYASSITAENALKWQATEQAEGAYNFDEANTIVNWALKNKKRVHGHVLVWHMYPPNWLKNYQGDSAKYELLMKRHIQTVVGQYKNKIMAWDVVNEAIYHDGTMRLAEQDPNKSWEDGSVWHQKLGGDFIERAFRYAHEANPKAKLFYNDYGQEGGAQKNEGTIALVKQLLRNGAPIHGIGLQMHMRLDTPDANIEKAIADAAATGLLVHISELDMVCNLQKDPNFVMTSQLAEQQANKFAFVINAYKRLVPKAQQYGITTWNVADADSWLLKFYGVPDAPLLFDKQYKPKPALIKTVTALK